MNHPVHGEIMVLYDPLLRAHSPLHTTSKIKSSGDIVLTFELCTKGTLGTMICAILRQRYVHYRESNLETRMITVMFGRVALP